MIALLCQEAFRALRGRGCEESEEKLPAETRFQTYESRMKKFVFPSETRIFEFIHRVTTN